MSPSRGVSIEHHHAYLRPVGGLALRPEQGRESPQESSQSALYRRLERSGRVKPLRGVASQRASQGILQLPRNVAPLGSERGNLVDRLVREDLLGRLAGEGRPAQQREVGDGAEGVQVGPLVHALAEQLLGRGELRRSPPRRGAAET